MWETSSSLPLINQLWREPVCLPQNTAVICLIPTMSTLFEPLVSTVHDEPGTMPIVVWSQFRISSGGSP